VINRLWTGHITAETPDERLEEAWANAKKAVATYLLWATRQGEEHKAIAKATDELAIIGITLEGEEPDPAKLDRMRELNLEITELRKRSKPTNKQCFEALKHEERLTKEFFKRFKPKTSHSAIPELFITGDWDAPGDDARPTTTSDEGIRKELRKYYVWLYQERAATRDPELENVLESQPLKARDSTALEGRITLEELTKAIGEIGNGKSAGPDALPAEFYKSYTELVKHDFLRVLNFALAEGQLSVSMRETDLDPTPTPPAKWGEGYKANKRTEYPLPDEYTLDGQTTLETQLKSHT